jgi:hypothetical protein
MATTYQGVMQYTDGLPSNRSQKVTWSVIFNPASEEYRFSTVMGAYEITAPADVIAEFQTTPLYAKVGKLAAVAQQQQIAKTLTHVRVTGGKNAGRIGRIDATAQSMYRPGLCYRIEQNGHMFFAHEDEAVRITADEYEALRAGTIKRCCICGVTLRAGEAMSASLGTTCADCYDEAAG